MDNEQKVSASDIKEITSKPEVNVEKIWMNYVESKGGLTWGESEKYPEYKKERYNSYPVKVRSMLDGVFSWQVAKSK